MPGLQNIEGVALTKPHFQPAVADIRFEHLPPSDLMGQWDDYVIEHSKGTIFHTSGMHKVFDNTQRNEPWSMAAVNHAGRIVALLTAVRVETVSGLASRFASRSIMYSEPICDDSEEGKAALKSLIRAHDAAMRGRILFCEIRPTFARGREYEALTDCGYEYKDYLNYVVDLTNESELQTRASKSCRKQIRKCGKRGVQTTKISTHESVDAMYDLVRNSYERSQVPLVHVEAFHQALDVFGPKVVEVRLTNYEDKIVAAGIALKFKDVVYAWYGGARRVTGLSPFAFLTWDEIESGSKEGFRYYDFGGAGWPDEPYGPREFKSKFGGELVNYGRYRKVNSAWKLSAATRVFTAVKRIKLVLGGTAE